MEKNNSDSLIENYFDDTTEEYEDKPLTTIELKTELEKLSQDIKNKCCGSNILLIIFDKL